MHFVVLSTIDPDFSVFSRLSSDDLRYVTPLRESLADKSRWPFAFAQILAPEVKPDLEKLRETPEFIVWKSSLYSKYQMGAKQRFFTLIKVLQEGWADSNILGHEIHEKLEDGFEGKWLTFAERFCEEMFSHSFDKCLGQLKATFDPSKNQYPPFFDMNKHITQVEVSKVMAQQIPFLSKFIGPPMELQGRSSSLYLN